MLKKIYILLKKKEAVWEIDFRETAKLPNLSRNFLKISLLFTALIFSGCAIVYAIFNEYKIKNQRSKLAKLSKIIEEKKKNKEFFISKNKEFIHYKSIVDDILELLNYPFSTWDTYCDIANYKSNNLCFDSISIAIDSGFDFKKNKDAASKKQSVKSLKEKVPLIDIELQGKIFGNYEEIITSFEKFEYDIKNKSVISEHKALLSISSDLSRNNSKKDQMIFKVYLKNEQKK